MRSKSSTVGAARASAGRGFHGLCRALAAALTPCLVLAAGGGAAPQTAQPPPALSAVPDHPSGIYRAGETVGWTVTAAAGADQAGYRFTIKRNGREVLASGGLQFSGGVARIELPASEPEMLYVEITTPPASAAALALGAAVDPQALRPSVPRPADFTGFWRRKLRELAAVPAAAVLSPAASEREGVDYATLVMATVQGAHIHGQIARPSGGAKLPGLVIFQWAGGPYPLQRSWVTDRAAEGWLALNVEPHDVLPDQPQSYYDALPAELKSYQTIGRRDRDTSYFLRMYLSDYRAIEYLAGRPDWDGKTLVVMGTSMGGQQSLCAAALNPRVTALIVNEPSGADSNGELHGRMAGYPFWPSDDPQVMRTALYFDTVSCAPQIRAASLVSMGFTDITAPPAGIWTAFNQISAPKEAVPMPDSPHNHLATQEQQRPYTERSAQWLEALRRTGQPPAPAAPRR
jgi:cephalosporin-C deacetylase-like acetyl esterase